MIYEVSLVVQLGTTHRQDKIYVYTLLLKAEQGPWYICEPTA